MLHRHGGALEVPARKSAAPARRLPRQLAVLAGDLPDREVRRIALVGLDLAAMAGPERLDGIPRESAVARVARDRVVDVAGTAPIRVPEVLEPLGQLDHLLDVLRRPRKD